MGLYFDSEDKETLINSVTVLDVVNYLGLATQRRGSCISILCPSPSHNDRHFGSCMIDKNGRFCKCYACGRVFNSLDILIYAGYYSFYDALCILAEISGTSNNFEASSKKHCKKKIISPEIKKELGLDVYGRIRNITGIRFSRPEKGDCFRDENGDFITYDSGNWNPWQDLLKNEPDVADWLIRNKCEEKMMDLYSFEKEIRNPMSSERSCFFYELAKAHHYSLKNFLSILNEKGVFLKETYFQYGGKCTSIEQIADKLKQIKLIMSNGAIKKE